MHAWHERKKLYLNCHGLILATWCKCEQFEDVWLRRRIWEILHSCRPYRLSILFFLHVFIVKAAVHAREIYACMSVCMNFDRCECREKFYLLSVCEPVCRGIDTAYTTHRPLNKQHKTLIFGRGTDISVNLCIYVGLHIWYWNQSNNWRKVWLQLLSLRAMQWTELKKYRCI